MALLHTDPRHAVMTVSLLTSVVMLVGKLTAYLVSNSTAILADAAESVVHGAATTLAALSLWYADRPADATHPYGHGRIAYFSAGFEGALVFSASLAVLVNGVHSLLYGTQLRDLQAGLAISAILAAINMLLGAALVRIGRRHNSLIVSANGWHVLSDMWTTLAAIIGVGLVVMTGMPILDPLTALALGGYIMYTGVDLMRRAYSGLMDRVDPLLSEKLLVALRASVQNGLLADYHQVRYRRVNDELWIDMHVLVPGQLSLHNAHEQVTRVEDALRALFPADRVHITSHIEPADHEAAHPGGHEEIVDPLRAGSG